MDLAETSQLIEPMTFLSQVFRIGEKDIFDLHLDCYWYRFRFVE